MQVSIFVRFAVVLVLLAAVVSGKQCGSGKEGMAVRRNRYMTKSYKIADPSTQPFDWDYCRDWCMMKSKCRAWEYKSNSEGGRCDLHKKGYKWVKYSGQGSTYAGRCWPN